MVRVFIRLSGERGAGRAVVLCALAAMPLVQCFSTSDQHGDEGESSAGSSAGEGLGGSSEGGAGGSGGSAGANGGNGASAVGGGGSSAGDTPGASGDAAVAGSPSSGGDAGAGTGSPSCGDGATDDGEACDDGNVESGDGCSATCSVEACAPGDEPCIPPTCGDGEVQAGEACDDGNLAALDGCSPTCTVEPTCDAAGCESACGDGIVSGDETCDDGNSTSGDGCSEACGVEAGFTCSAATCDSLGGSCVLRLPALFRDFNAHDTAGGHPDFGPPLTSVRAVQGLVEPELDEDGKPVLSAAASVANGFMHGPESFADWYRTGIFNSAINGDIVLWGEGDYFVNRWGASGQRWTAPLLSTEVTYGGPAGNACASCTLADGQVCHDPCRAEFWDDNSCCGPAELPSYDGNPLFFPIDGAPTALTEPRGEGKVPAPYGFAGFPWESMAAITLGVSEPVPTATAPFPSMTHNFHFTTEVRLWFRYEAGKNYLLDLQGDDDVWVFLNGKLALDLGGWHPPLSGSLSIDALGVVYSRTILEDGDSSLEVEAPGAEFGLADGELHSIAIFHAERQPEGSSFRLGLQGFDAQRSVCTR